MPGTQSRLERHEWTKHGTCYGASQEDYFRHAIAAIEGINGTAVRDFFAANVGQQVTLQQIRAAFDQAFGDGAGLRVRVACKDDGGRRLITELTIGFGAPVADADRLADIIMASGPTDGGCTAGVIDPVGLQ
jgi:ribonuclease T2